MNSLYSVGKEQIWRKFPTFSTSPFFFENHFYFHFLPCRRRELILLYDFVEDLSHHFSRPIVACFDVFGSDSVAVWGFAFFEFVDCSSQLFCRDLWDSRHLIGVVVMQIGAALIFILPDFLFRFFLFIVVV